MAAYKALEGGWGWVILVGCSIVFMTCTGPERAYGVLYIYLLDKYKQSATVTAWAGGLNTALRIGAALFGAMVANRFSLRTAAFAGATLRSLGYILSAFAPSMPYLYVTIGALAGLGGALIQPAALTIITQYFEKRRGVALGISTAAGGLASFLLPLLTEIWLEEFSFFGTMLLIGGFVMHMFISASLFRPIKENYKEYFSKTRKTGNISDSKSNAKNSEIEQPNKRNFLFDYVLLFKNKSFVLYCAAVFTSFASNSAIVFLPAMAEQKGFGKNIRTMSVSAIGLTEIFTRIIFGLIYDLKVVRPRRQYIYAGFVLLSALLCLLMVFIEHNIAFMVLPVLFGLTTANMISQRVLILADIVPAKDVSSAIGVSSFFMGISLFLTPAIGGYLKDVTGDYNSSFYFFSAVTATGGLLFIVDRLHTDCVVKPKQLTIPVDNDFEIPPVSDNVSLEQNPRVQELQDLTFRGRCDSL